MIFDTNVLFAAFDTDDANHRVCREVFDAVSSRIVPDTVVTETAFMVSLRLGVTGEARFLTLVDADFDVVPVEADDRVRAAELLVKYRDSNVGYVDASIVAVAERLHEDTVATLDRRHFSMFRPEGIGSFQIVP